ncbi:hypothetical protein [Paenibacillus ferrarius]|uniref:hypothetical protein n=1 Tax=Paenibacillus ferrarius TaxID=1469647 RepID=UPI003D2E9770
MSALPQKKLKNTFFIPQDIQDSITSDKYKKFLIENNLPISSQIDHKAGRIETIENAISSGKISLSTFLDFLAVELKRNRNRTAFFSSLDNASATKLASYQFVQSNLIEAQLPSANFNSLLDSIRPDETKCAYLQVDLSGNTVTYITLCFTEKVQLRAATLNTHAKHDTDFTWIEIDIKNKIVTIRVYDRNNTFGAMTDKAKFQYYNNQLKMIFGIQFTDMSYQRNTLYKIFNELTSKAEEPFTERTQSTHELTEKFIKDCISGLSLQNESVVADFSERLKNLQMRSLIQENFKEYSSYSEGKKGLVDRYFYTDKTGASVNAKTNDEERSISLYDIYLDTKHSIDKLMLIDKLWVTWYRKTLNRLGITKIEKIKTKIEVFKECYVIHFLYDFLNEEAESHVLSEFRNFERTPN